MGVSLLPPEKRPRTKDEDEDDWEMTLNTYYGTALLRDAFPKHLYVFSVGFPARRAKIA